MARPSDPPTRQHDGQIPPHEKMRLQRRKRDPSTQDPKTLLSTCLERVGAGAETREQQHDLHMKIAGVLGIVCKVPICTWKCSGKDVQYIRVAYPDLTSYSKKKESPRYTVCVPQHHPSADRPSQAAVSRTERST